ncbi:MAG: hypothetical protein C0394_02010 [Syntrophus sp. (in: bacteria)]|nr:hypothetical protein [Syntrophus sp. (in: bacteria)]
MSCRPQNSFFILFVCPVLVLFISACTELRLRTMPSPEPAAKLRVLFLPMTDTVFQGRYWAVPHNVFAEQMVVSVQRTLRNAGFYDVVPQEDIKTVLGDTAVESIHWDMGHWSAARKVGRALHADYVMICRRGFQGFYYVRMLLINLETGKVFETTDHPGSHLSGSAHSAEYRKIVQARYRDIFNQAKGDMLATALRKGSTAYSAQIVMKPSEGPTSTPESASSAVIPVTPATPPPACEEALPAATTENAPAPPPAVAVQKPSVERKSLQDMTGPSIMEGRESEKTRIVVYDLETPQPMRVAGLIITEALREEIHKTGFFDIVNREDIGTAVEEMKLQQSGLVQMQGAVQMGRLLAARQSVTGRLGPLGSSIVLQIKRTDIETMGTLSFGSITAPAGREEDFLNGLPELARKLLRKQ